jgi:4-amino-4-deoxy-L-arabinose transferase-like glycosyltransferase
LSRQVQILGVAAIACVVAGVAVAWPGPVVAAIALGSVVALVCAGALVAVGRPTAAIAVAGVAGSLAAVAWVAGVVQSYEQFRYAGLPLRLGGVLTLLAALRLMGPGPPHPRRRLISVAAEPAPSALATRPVTGAELFVVFVIALAVLLPGVWSYTLIDPWETHYGEVSRRMLEDDDLVHTKWQDEGFRSKPVLTFWLMAGSMKALDVGDDGGYSGEMVSSPRVMLAIRLPFVLFGVLGLCAAWWMLARLASRRIAWLSLLVLGTTPFYLFVARQGITDMTLVGSMIGAIAMFAVASEVRDEPVRPLWRIGRVRPIAIDHRHIFLVIVGGFLLWQAVYYLGYFLRDPRPGPGAKIGTIHPALLTTFPILGGMGLLLAMELNVRPIRALAYWITAILSLMVPIAVLRTLALTEERRYREVFDAPRTTTTRQVYLWWFWAFLGISVLGKGLPALGIVGIVCAFYVVLLGRWRDFVTDRFELVRGFALVALIAVPWHVAMYIRDGRRFVHDYFITHLWNRAAVGVHGDRGTFDFYVSQVGYGMFVWAALVPAAIAALVLRSRTDTPEGRARIVVAMWAVTSVAFFSLVQTKFHHYILPAIPALAIAIGFWLDDVLAGRARGVGVAALIGAAIVLAIANDMMGEQKQWIEMFIYRYDRPWPGAAPWEVDVSDAFLGLGVAAAAALALFAVPRLSKVGVAAIAVVALGAGMWSMHVYMPTAATHWGMRDAMREYYDRREIHGMRLVYYGSRQVAEDWGQGDGVRDRWTIRTHVPETAQVGQPAVFRITVRSVDDRTVDHEVRLVGTVTEVEVDGAALHVTLPASETARLAPIVKAGRGKGARRSARRPIREVDADRLISWQLYWRGETFWSGAEIWGPLPEMRTTFNEFVNKGKKVEDHLGDRELSPPGRRYWVVTEAGRASTLKGTLPTQRAKETYRIENTVSNKFSLASFEL